MSDIKKILVIGSKDFAMSTEDWRIESFGWDEIERIENPYDYNLLIINLVSICDSRARDNIQWSQVKSKFCLEKTMKMLKSDHGIILVGDPRFDFPLEDGTKTQFLWWTGLIYEWDNLPGKTKCPSNPPDSLDKYMQKLDKWDYSLKDVYMYSKVQPAISLYMKEKEVRLGKKFFYVNSLHFALAFSVFFQMPRRRPRPDDYTAPIIFLPKINATEEETLGIVLRDVCGVEIMTPEPSWVKQRVVPGQKSIDEKIRKRRKVIEREQKHLENDEDERIKVRECLKLLYAGDYELESVVWDVLDEFGGNVERPTVKGKEDGWIYPQVGSESYPPGVLEIKGTKSNQFGEDGIGQLAKWKDRGSRLRKEKYKGVFIGNSCRDKPPSQRPEPFADGWRKSADISEICALTTTDLYRLYELKCCGKLNAQTFWSDVFRTNGILNIDEYFSSTIPK